MAETYTNGLWTVKPGEENAFVADWSEFVNWAGEQPGSGVFRLVCNTDEPAKFMSFGSWETFEAQDAWKQQPEFRERIGRVIGHCEDFQPLVYELVAEVD